MPSLFEPMTIRGLQIKNRAWVSPMCQYSAVEGVVGEWHHIHIGGMASGGAGLIMAEATGVVAEGRISIGCPGLYNDDQVDAWKPIVDFAHSMGAAMGIQLAHAGRKAGTALPFDGFRMATTEEGGWQAVAPSALAFEGYPVPKELTISEIQSLVNSFGEAARRAVKAGFDVIEIHAAHGYLLHEFYSPLSNFRTDEYGGNYAGRTRLLKEVVSEVRKNIPGASAAVNNLNNLHGGDHGDHGVGMPLFVRISATDWVEGGWGIEESVQLATDLKALGADLIDVSSGGNIPNAKIPVGPGYQVGFAEQIKNRGGILTSAVGMITEPLQANEIITSGKADAVMLARELLRNPRWPLYAASKLGIDIAWPHQISRGRPAK
jgi:2,4-dienoyl-CoA reductase-like NADH-dependent reductase (Old Yellow Enzyme family)